MNEHDELACSLQHNRVSRRQVLWLLGAGSIGLTSLSGCATSPVGGGSILVGMSEEEEKRVDAQVSPQQFSQDLGPIQDAAVNRYVSEIGQRLDANTHRPQMPYSYRVLNANYVNAYTFPGGAMGVTRGILVDLDNEAELAALLGHELGHVNARHAAQRQGQAKVAQVAVAGASLVGSATEWGGLISMGSQFGASVLLSSYSRDNEREADALGQEYMVRAGYPATGMVGLHQLLVDQEKSSPSMLQTMFSTHPMSRERRDTAVQLAENRYAASRNAPPGRERFMDNTASLRRIKPTIDACQNGESAMGGKQYGKAEEQFRSALKQTPRDYAANVRMAQCLQAQDKNRDALGYAEAAKKIYPQEAQSHKLAGVLSLGLRDPGAAYNHLDQYDRLMPGDAGVTFLKGVSLEGMGNKQEAARHYSTYLRQTRQGKAAEYAQSRLQGWGYLR
ncbi:M48 family metalloprotease [Dechloromonas sp. TW-R-39-2]|uniref:M48 family metalloprotease n=1 Tax=Dechloromonas sp. TW-R-39-2 TaxID=2654218 RepID=UPI00193CE1D0|nr:M48 family metalloprotease [Dechloromonas sp. TW-R-39-2]QRM18518.1 M48 family metalloprotease [Dechloromonas sp. TW-R-39-2]